MENATNIVHDISQTQYQQANIIVWLRIER